MDFVWVLPFILVFLSGGQSYAEVAGDACYSSCPRGYHKVGNCETPAAPFRCEKCTGDTFTAITNTAPSCLRCGACSHDEMEVKACSFDSDVVCDCKEGFYYTMIRRFCQKCPDKNCNGSDNKTECPRYRRGECAKNCNFH